jgi:hypothetical protein
VEESSATEQEEDVEDNEPKARISPTQALDMATQLMEFASQRGNQELLNMADNCKSLMEVIVLNDKAAAKQTKISSFF